jgi:hypothetical protein
MGTRPFRPLALALAVAAALPAAGLPGSGGAAALDACPEGRTGYEDFQGGLVFEPVVEPSTGMRVCYPSTVFRRATDDSGAFRFVSDDGLAWFTLTRAPGDGRPPRDLAEEATRRLAGERASVTYRRTTEDWFVLSGYRGERIYYLKSVLAEDGAAVDTFLIEFPREQRPFYYDIVERMSWSFRGR